MERSWRALCVAVSCVQALPSLSDDGLALALASSSVRPGPGPGGASPTEPDDDPEELRLRALVDLACGGDAEAFGQLYDHYLPGIFRFVYYRVSSRQLAEDITSEAFTRALRSIAKFQWQGKDFGAWLTTIARNLITDHFKSSRARLEIVADEVPESGRTEPSPEDQMLEGITSSLLMAAVRSLPDEQRDCLLMRFVQGLSIAQTAAAMGRSDGAVKQLQLRAVRKLAREVPRGAVL